MNTPKPSTFTPTDPEIAAPDDRLAPYSDVLARSAVNLTKAEAAFYVLRLAIENGELQPGDPLRVGELSPQLRMSPTPIREALRMLQSEGLVSLQPHHGATVASFPEDRVEEVYLLRAILEPLATQFATQRATVEELASLRRLHEELARAVESGAPRTDIPQLTKAWHHQLYTLSRSPVLLELIRRLWTAIPFSAGWRTDHASQWVAEHVRVMDLMEGRDAAGAAELMKQHVVPAVPPRNVV